MPIVQNSDSPHSYLAAYITQDCTIYNIEIWHLDSFSLDKTTLFSLTKQLAPNQNHQANESGRENVIKYFSREASILQIWNVKKEDYITISTSYQVKFPKLGLHWKILD